MAIYTHTVLAVVYISVTDNSKGSIGDGFRS